MTWFSHPLKKCKKCGKWFDIGTNKDLCPICNSKVINNDNNYLSKYVNKQNIGVYNE